MAPKRKATDTTAANQPPRARGRSGRGTKKAQAATDSTESESFPGRQAKRARGAASTTGTARQDNDLEDDSGRYLRGSKPATIEQHLMDQNKKSKEFIQQFKEQVAQGRQRVQENLAAIRKDLHQPSLLAPEIYTALHSETTTAPASTNNSSTLLLSSSSRTKTSNDHSEANLEATNTDPLPTQTHSQTKIQTQSQHLLRLSRALLACHNTADRQAARAAEGALTMGPPPSASSLPSSSPSASKKRKQEETGEQRGGEKDEKEEGELRATWARDAESMRALLACGRAYAVRVVEGWITPAAKGMRTGMGAGMAVRGGGGGCGGEYENEDGDGGDEFGGSETEKLAMGMFQWGGREKGAGLGLGENGGREEESWGMLARKQLVALTGVVKTLPCHQGKP